jgi:rhodanese-related sulfurtransferase
LPASRAVSSSLRALPLRAASAVVVYCVHGHEVSQGVAAVLQQRGIAARYLEGGIEEGWRTVGGDLDRRPTGGNTQ